MRRYGQNCPAPFIRPHPGLWLLPGIASSSLKTKASVDYSWNSISPNLLSYQSPQFVPHRKPTAVFWVCFLIRKHPRFCGRQTGINLGIGLHLAWAMRTTSPNNIPSNLLATESLTCIAVGCMHAPLQILEYICLSFHYNNNFRRILFSHTLLMSRYNVRKGKPAWTGLECMCNKEKLGLQVNRETPPFAILDLCIIKNAYD